MHFAALTARGPQRRNAAMPQCFRACSKSLQDVQSPGAMGKERVAQALPAVGNSRLPSPCPAPAGERTHKNQSPARGLYGVFCAVLYLPRSGWQWRRVPEEFPQWRTVHSHFAVWSEPRGGGILLERALKKPGLRWHPSAGMSSAALHGCRRTCGCGRTAGDCPMPAGSWCIWHSWCAFLAPMPRRLEHLVRHANGVTRAGCGRNSAKIPLLQGRSQTL